MRAGHLRSKRCCIRQVGLASEVHVNRALLLVSGAILWILDCGTFIAALKKRYSSGAASGTILVYDLYRQYDVTP
ncbi:hypothetical protein PSPTOT1_0903 [Pseudomonas syringae pv. tomato T1]|nr:hypothetical protein PSPTOT1_0903 [Pseudomonas syringae pv. tomato T1]